VESLRWILIAVGIVFIVAIYMLGKHRRQRDLFSSDEFVSEMDNDSDADLDMGLPEFSARNLDDVDEGVGAVRVVSGGDRYDEIEKTSSLDASDDSFDDAHNNEEGLAETNKASTGQTTNNKPNDIIVIYILPKGDALLEGSQINSTAQALGLNFGEMNIFHYANDGRNVFSLANMLEPGSFNSETIHALKTTGLTLFMQIEGDAMNDSMNDLSEMLQRGYQIAGLLEARLCNHKREPLTEQDAENYRAQVRDSLLN
jgi:cell division protein ZipA